MGLGAGHELGCATAHPSHGPCQKMQTARGDTQSELVSFLSPINTGAAAPSCRKGRSFSNPHKEKPC